MNNAKEVIPSNFEMNDVVKSFRRISPAGKRVFYETYHNYPTTSSLGLIKSHFKGIASYKNQLIFTHSNLLPVIHLDSNPGKILIADKLTSGDQGNVSQVYDTNPYHHGWSHPCSAQACGSFMAMGLQNTDDGSCFAEIHILDLTPLDSGAQPVSIASINSVFRTNGQSVPSAVNGVAMTKESGVDGKYIVAGLQYNALTIYKSVNAYLDTENPDNQFYVAGQTVQDFPVSGAGLALITEKKTDIEGSGGIYLIALDAKDDGSNNRIYLYKLTISDSSVVCSGEIASMAMPVPGLSEAVRYATTAVNLAAIGVQDPACGLFLTTFVGPIEPLNTLNTSFRWGKGLAITSPDEIEIYSTDRNDLTTSRFSWPVDTQKDFSLVTWSTSDVSFTGIAGYDLADPADRVFAFDYDGSGKADHLVLYRPGTGTIWILKNESGIYTPVYNQGDPGNGIGGYNLDNPIDQAFAFDYDSSGTADHLVLYRPGTGTIWILKNVAGTFTPVYNQGDPGNGIGGYNLDNPIDQVFAFDYDSSGKADHLVLYRPGTGTIWILKNLSGTFIPVYNQGEPGNGIGGYDLASYFDCAFAFDYDGSGKADHLVLYRPGTGTIWILKNVSGTFTPVYKQGEPGNGIGGYDLADPIDRIFAFDYDNSGKADHLVAYRAGTGTIWILKNVSGTFIPVYNQGYPGKGIGGYDLASVQDRVCAFDLSRQDEQAALVLYRPGSGMIAIIPTGPGLLT